MASLTIIMPALNEEKNLKTSVNDLENYLKQHALDYELLIFNDGSTDNTPAIADELADYNPKIKVIHNPMTLGLGYNYRKGVELATKEFIIMIPADGENSLEGIVEHISTADIIVPFVLNTELRPRIRRIISRIFTFLVNVLSGLHLKYYNGTVLHKTQIIKNLPNSIPDGFGYQAEILVNLIKKGFTYKQVGVYLKKPSGSRSNAFKLKNFISVSRSLCRIFLLNFISKNGKETINS